MSKVYHTPNIDCNMQVCGYLGRCRKQQRQHPPEQDTAAPWVGGQPCVSGTVDVPIIAMTWTCGLRIDPPIYCGAPGSGTDAAGVHRVAGPHSLPTHRLCEGSHRKLLLLMDFWCGAHQLCSERLTCSVTIMRLSCCVSSLQERNLCFHRSMKVTGNSIMSAATVLVEHHTPWMHVLSNVRWSR